MDGVKRGWYGSLRAFVFIRGKSTHLHDFRQPLPLRFDVMRHFAVIASGICAFVLTCLLIDRMMPARELPWLVREKVAYVATHGGEYDALFMGSSRVNNNIIAAMFDRTAAGRGFAIKSFNAAIPGLYPPQDAYLLERILGSKPAHLRWVFLEMQYLQTALPPANLGTLEQVYWHDWPRFSLLFRHIVLMVKKRRHWRDEVEEAWRRWPQMRGHTLLFVQYFTNLGRGFPLLQRWVTHEPAAPLEWGLLGENRDGWLPISVPPVTDQNVIARLDKDLLKRRTHPPIKDFSDPVTQEGFDKVIAQIRRAGATPVLIVPPNAARGNYFYPDPRRTQQCIVLDFCDPQRYPELYATEHRIDTSHLNEAGAEIFTRLLAERFVEAVAPQR